MDTFWEKSPSAHSAIGSFDCLMCNEDAKARGVDLRVIVDETRAMAKVR